ncbi:MAG: hypothetical protein KatS3mg068_2024 [Candidatus Sericytochromatia bacterium]|nr:MAG: hypothetical protein KatS3mg068_2024 [Candidatus Sericytochromatia bacterium]
MDDFSKYFKNMLDNLIKGLNSQDINFDIKAFDLTSGNQIPFMNMFLGNNTNEKKEKVVVRKLTNEELKTFNELNERRDYIQSQFKRLLTLQKKLEADTELFWQDIKDNSKIKTDISKLSIDPETGFLFQEVNVNLKEEG